MPKERPDEYLEKKIRKLEKRVLKCEQAEKALRESEERFRALFEFAPDAYYLNDLQGTFIDGNKAAEKMIGYKKDELVGKNFLKLGLFPPDQLPTVTGALARNVEGKPTGPDELTLFRKDGTTVIVEIRTFPITIKRKPVVLGIARDITKRKLAEEKLKTQEKERSMITENIPGLVSYVDADGCYRFVNNQYEKWFGISRKEIIGQHYRHIVGDPAYRKIKRYVEQALSGKQAQYEQALPYKSVGTRWVNARYVPDIDQHGIVKGFFALITDVTERKQAEEARQVSEASYRELANSITDVFFAMDKELRYTYWNKASEDLTGISARDAIGKSLLDIFPDTSQTRRAEKVYREVLRTRQPQTFINQYHLGDKDFFFEISAYPSGRGLSIFVKDVTERKQREETIQRYVKRLEVINDVHHAILESTSAEQIVTTSLSHVPKLFPCIWAGIAHFDFQARKALLLGVYPNSKAKLAPGTDFPLSFFGITETLQQGKINQVEDVRALTGRSPIYQTLSDQGVRSCVNIPLIASGDLVGCLSLGSNDFGPFFPERLEPILEIAQPMAIAIHHALQLSSLANHREQLRFLTKRLLEADESEKRLLARELHDQVGRNLTALGLNLTVLSNYLSPQGKALLDDSSSLVEQTTRQIREVMVELRPPPLDEYGLAAALRFCAERFSKRTRMPVLDNIQLARRLSPTVENAFFRIAQEALNNIAKHAGASQAILVLEEKEKKVRLTISDDGKGFDPTEITQQQPETKWGLLSMRERAIAVGARLDVKAQTGKGTEIVVEWPRD
jgi:PAS domain S-box-containing protein